MEIKAYKQIELAHKEGVVPRTILNNKNRLVKVVYTSGKKTCTRYLDFETSKILMDSEGIASSSNT